MKTDASEPRPRLPRRLRLVLDALPKGRALPPEVWERRHRGILVLLWLNAVGLACFGLLAGYGWIHSLLEGAAPVAAFGILGWWPTKSRALRAVAASFGLLTSSAVLVHLSGGYIEMHFHFFVMVSVIALYQDWIPFLVAIGYVLVQHGFLGVIDPGSVYNHPAGIANPWRWAAIHAAFVLGASVSSIVNWRAHETARARTELILDSAGEGIYGLDPSGNATFVNAAAATMLGWEVEEVLGRPTHAILHHSKPDGTPYPRGECPIYAAFQDGAVHRVDGEVFWRKDGTSFPVEYVSTPIREGRELTGAVVTFKDVTERKQAEEARTGLEKQLRQSQKMEAVGRLTGGIAHDFNNLLTIIKGRTEFLLQGSGPEGPLRRHSEIIRKAADRAAALTQQLLAFSRKQLLQPKVLDPNAVITGLVPLLQRLVREDIELVTVLGAGLGRVKADPGQLEQVIVNLVANARDAMPKGGQITIETANVEPDDAVGPRDPAGRPRRSVMLVVRDTGVGMRSEIQADIFEPFFTTKEVGKGTGLGLATVYGIVTQHEGVIRVESAPGRGATFRIYLPRIEDAVDTVEPIEPPALRSIRRGGSETVLLVEDEEEVRALAAEVLQGQGYTLLEAAHPHEALRLAERWTAPIHLLLTDVVMPRMSGRQLADRLAGVRPAMKILYMSGYTDDIIARDGLLDPGTPLLAKPFTPDGLAEKVRAVLDAPREREGPTPVAARSPREG